MVLDLFSYPLEVYSLFHTLRICRKEIFLFHHTLRSSLCVLSSCIVFLWGCRKGSCIADPSFFMNLPMIWASDEIIAS